MPPLSTEQIELLAEKKLLGTITPEEQLMLDQWLNSKQDNYTSWEGEDDNETNLKERLLNRIKKDAGIGEYAVPMPRERFIGQRWWWAAAVLILFTGSYFLFIHSRKQPVDMATANSLPYDIAAPVNNRAMISLANGKTVYLDSVADGSLATQGSVSIVKLADGQIAYSGVTSEIFYNTLSNPRGSKAVTITLSDGTKVWLNSESSLRYPVSFTGNERKVEITGEAYFEVAPSISPEEGGKQRSFIVSKDNVQVQVLGTHFNVNAYEDENDIKVTLLEGSVKVKTEVRSERSEVKGEKSEVIIKPGQQAIVTHDSRLTTHNSPDLDQVMAWKNELFSLKSADIKTVMRQVARWYDVDIEYKGEVTEKFIVKMDRNTNVSNVFKILEATGGVHFNIEGRKITVLP